MLFSDIRMLILTSLSLYKKSVFLFSKYSQELKILSS